MARRLEQWEIDEMVRMREDRKRSVTYIRRYFGVSAGAVNYHLLKNGVDPYDPTRGIQHTQRGAFSPEEDARMLDLGKQGKSPWEISRIIGRPKTSVLLRILLLEVRAENALVAP